jgi:hypothetical protein
MINRHILLVCLLLFSLQATCQQWIVPGSGAYAGITSFHIENEDIIGAQLTDLRFGTLIGYRFGSHWEVSGEVYWQSEDAYKDIYPSQVLTRDEWLMLDHRRVIITPRIAYTDSLTVFNVPAVITLGVAYRRGWDMADEAEEYNGQFRLSGFEAGGLLSRRVDLRWEGIFFNPGIGVFATFNTLTDTSGFGLEDMREDRILFDGTYGGLDLSLPLTIRLSAEQNISLSLLFSVRAVIFSEFDRGFYGNLGNLIFNF